MIIIMIIVLTLLRGGGHHVEGGEEREDRVEMESHDWDSYIGQLIISLSDDAL